MREEPCSDVSAPGSPSVNENADARGQRCRRGSCSGHGIDDRRTDRLWLGRRRVCNSVGWRRSTWLEWVGPEPGRVGCLDILRPERNARPGLAECNCARGGGVVACLKPKVRQAAFCAVVRTGNLVRAKWL